jgi:D-glycero-alpha-D-manno-heptose-7-phosphate kinase
MRMLTLMMSLKVAVIFEATDLNIREEIDLTNGVTIEGKLKLHRAVYLRV